MKPFNALSVILGSLISVCLLIVFENLFGMIYLCPGDGLILNHDLFLQKIKCLPSNFYLLVTFCNSMACYMGGMLPVIIGDEKLKRSIYIGLIVSLFAIANGLFMPFPTWYTIVSACICLPFSFLGGMVTKRLFEPQLN